MPQFVIYIINIKILKVQRIIINDDFESTNRLRAKTKLQLTSKMGTRAAGNI